jgi:hypothetical protein
MKHCLGGFERKILRIIHGAIKIDSVWRSRYKELYSLLNKVDIIKRIKTNRLRWAGHVTKREIKKLLKE